MPFSVEYTRRKLEESLRVSAFSASGADVFEETLGRLLDSRDVAAELRRLSSEISSKYRSSVLKTELPRAFEQ